jgi:hypothetical protein
MKTNVTLKLDSDLLWEARILAAEEGRSISAEGRRCAIGIGSRGNHQRHIATSQWRAVRSSQSWRRGHHCARWSQRLRPHKSIGMLGQKGEFARWEAGAYENEFIKQDDIWKIQAVRYYPRMTADYDKGWANDDLPAPVASKEFPPDRPPSQTFKSYPEAYTPAFHYANPVTGRPVRYPSGGVVRVQAVKTSSYPRTMPDMSTISNPDRLIEELVSGLLGKCIISFGDLSREGGIISRGLPLLHHAPRW